MSHVRTGSTHQSIGTTYSRNRECFVASFCRRPRRKMDLEYSVRDVIEEMKGLDQTETQSGKLSRKLKETPFLAVGLLGLVTACSVGAYRFKKRPVSMSASMYLMQLRIIAQGTVAGSLTAGIAYTFIKDHQCQAEEE